ncbi:MAG: ABC transporter substrate-binding protein [Clostridia bacterium]|nr:ABC transporter substrate-binding protein [Clostridia bacterium]
MKKMIAFILMAAMMVSFTAAFAETEQVTLRLGGLKGATSIGMVKLLSDAEKGETQVNYDFTMAAAADELAPLMIQGKMDVLAVPANLASVLYNKTEGKVQFAAVNTLGVVYVVEKGGETVQTVADLKGKTIYATGKGTTPEYALRYLLSMHGLDMDKDVTMEWKSEPTETVAAMKMQDNAVAMIPQPFVTVAQGQVENLRVALDLTKEWNALDNGSMFITAGLIVRKEFAEKNPEVFQAFLNEYKASTEYVNQNPAEAAQLVEYYGIVKAAVAEKAIPHCNITYIEGEEMKTALSGYLQVLFDMNPAAVGGKLPGEDFYYGK